MKSFAFVLKFFGTHQNVLVLFRSSAPISECFVSILLTLLVLRCMALNTSFVTPCEHTNVMKMIIYTMAMFDMFYLVQYDMLKCFLWSPYLKVPKREIFLTELIILSYPIWTGDLGTKAKN
jgi:hypothetical protein